VCQICREQIDEPEKTDVHHWRCLTETMWTQVPAVQVMVWRMLRRLNQEGWAQDLLGMLYLDEKTLAWAEAAGGEHGSEVQVKHLDSNGTLLASGDTVTLIKDLNVKGANFTAKRGATVRNISLVADNPEQIEGKVNGQQIVILTKFVKKAG
jgi:protein PhnA